MIKASAPAKLILFGEHAVVYGETAIATAVDKRAYATACELEGSKIIVNSKNIQEDIEASLIEDTTNPIVKAVQEALKFCKTKTGVGVEINSEIPVAVGLGSSASVVSATAMAVVSLFKENPDPLKIAEIALEAEKISHGNPSGVDTATTTLGGTIAFKKGTIEELKTEGLSLVIGNTGIRKSTKELVDKVRKSIEDPRMATSLFNISSLVKSAKTAIIQNNLDELGALMDKNHKFLRELGVSSPQLETLIKTAKKAGALGAKLTGAGGGGCIIALTQEPKKVIQALEKKGATAFQVHTNQEGVKIES